VLFAAYEEIHRQGFKAASLANIRNATGLTQGALYHHFANKQQLGCAVLDEVIAPMMTSPRVARSTTWRRRCRRWARGYAGTSMCCSSVA
jgi:AcrR family transcriptional regulator